MTRRYVKKDPGCGVVVGAILAFILFMAGLTALFGLVLMFAWNLVVPSAFNGPTLSFPQAWGLAILLAIISGIINRSSK